MQDGAGGGGGMHLLLSILADGEEQARRLGDLPDDPRLGVGAEHYRGATRRLQCTLAKAVSVAKGIIVEAAASGSSRGATDSPRSADESSGGTVAVEARERQGACKRRKGLPRWTAKFRVADASLEATPDDGFSWRKYGQKDILGAKFPRGYYRCTYRGAQGCLATKQVQRSDSDLCVFDVTYQGAHTCHQKQRHAVAAAAATSSHDIGRPPPPQEQDPSMELLAGFKECLKVETTTTEAPLHANGHDHGTAADSAPFSFSFPSGAVPVPSHDGVALAGDTVAAAFSSSSPAAGSSYYAVPHCLAPGSYDHYSYEYDLPGARVRGAESELGEVVSRATAADLSAARFDYSLYHHGEFDPHLPFAPSGGPTHR